MKIFKMLKDAGADANIQTNEGGSVAEIAIMLNDKKLQRLLDVKPDANPVYTIRC